MTCLSTDLPAERITSLMVETEEQGAVFQEALAELSTEQRLLYAGGRRSV